MAQHKPFDTRIYRQTHQWITRAAIRGLAPLVGKEKSDYPASIRLDDQLEENPSAPNIWVKPTEGQYAPLRTAEEGERIPNFHGKKNAFFEAVRHWRPTHDIGALGLTTKFRLEYHLDKEDHNRYLETVLYLTDDESAQEPGSLQKKTAGEAPPSAPVGGRGGRGGPGPAGGRGGRGRGDVSGRGDRPYPARGGRGDVGRGPRGDGGRGVGRGDGGRGVGRGDGGRGPRGDGGRGPRGDGGRGGGRGDGGRGGGRGGRGDGGGRSERPPRATRSGPYRPPRKEEQEKSEEQAAPQQSGDASPAKVSPKQKSPKDSPKQESPVKESSPKPEPKDADEEEIIE